ncbi:MAG: LysR family transcriptional regulator [Gammaproteobacteria bacterium]
MEISAVKAFIAIADTGSFSKAAELLFLTQPAVSKRLQLLETSLNTRLFDRIGRTITLTEAGKMLLPRARKILVDIEDSIRAVTNLSTEITGELRFATSHHIGLHRLPNILKGFSHQYPDVRLNISFMDSENACQLVESGELELAVVTLPLSPLPTLKTVLVWDDPLAVTVEKNHPMADRKKITLQQLSQYPAVLPSINTFTRQIVEKAFSAFDLSLNIYLSTNYLETIRMLVSAGIGWSVLPETMLDKNTCKLTVRELNLQRSLGIVYHRERTLSNAAMRFVEALQP